LFVGILLQLKQSKEASSCLRSPMMKANALLRAVLISAAFCSALALCVVEVPAQDVGAEVGGGAGIFRAKNPETKKGKAKPPKTTTKKSSTRRGSKAVRADIEEKVEELLDKGNEFRDAGNFAEAEASYQDVLKLKPHDGRAAYGLGNVYSDLQRWNDAEAAYRDAIQWDPKNADAYVALSVILVQPRPGGDNAKRFADAETFARRSVQIDPQNAVGWDRLGVAMVARNLLNSECEHSFRRAIELAPDFAVAYAHLARMLNRVGRSGEAVPLYAKASELAKDSATLNLIAESLQGEQQWPASEPVLKRALELEPRNSRSLVLMGRLMIVYKRYDEAEPYLKIAAETSPRAFEPLNLLARAYLGMNRLADAEETYERAAPLAMLAERKQLAGAYGFEGVGDGYMKANRNEDAARVYQRALELDPGNKVLEQKLSQARSR
jgi:tetratricopeptide (TPR) repeat protein